jgi:hypothetical protein
LAREASRHEIDRRQLFDVSDISYPLDIRESGRKHPLRGAVQLAKEFRTVPGSVEAQLNPADTGEQACNAESPDG